MIRQVDMNEISDGKKYSLNDLVKADCHGCENCSKCCTGMGNSIILDPFDVYVLTKELNRGFDSLLSDCIEIHLDHGLMIPNLKMNPETNACVFLNQEGRCQIHAFRPGICRLFPLGRWYEEDTEKFSYFLQTNECPYPLKTKIKVKKWLDMPFIMQHEKYIGSWHAYLRKLQERIEHCKNQDEMGEWNKQMLVKFFLLPYEKDRDFYEQFYERIGKEE